MRMKELSRAEIARLKKYGATYPWNPCDSLRLGDELQAALGVIVALLEKPVPPDDSETI